MDILKTIHNAIATHIERGFEPAAIILCAEANARFIMALKDYHRTYRVSSETFEGLPVFIVPDEPRYIGRDFWIKIAVKQYST
jgi:hypothetical protein